MRQHPGLLCLTAAAGASLPGASSQGAPVFWAVDSNGSWTEPSNWSPFQPGPSDDVMIDRPAGDYLVSLSDADVHIASLSLRERLSVANASLRVDGAASIENTLTLNNGALIGGDWTFAPGSSLQLGGLAGSQNRISGVTIHADLEFTQALKRLRVDSGFTLDGSMTLANNRITLSFDSGDQTLHQGTFAFLGTDPDPNAFPAIAAEGASTLTLAPGVIIHGGNGALRGDPASTIVSHASIAADDAGASLFLDAPRLINHGVIEAKNGGTLMFGVSDMSGSTGSLVVRSGSDFRIDGGSTVALRQAGFTRESGTTMSVTGLLDNAGQTLDAALLQGEWSFGELAEIRGGSIDPDVWPLQTAPPSLGTFRNVTLLDGDHRVGSIFVGGDIGASGVALVDSLRFREPGEHRLTQGVIEFDDPDSVHVALGDVTLTIEPNAELRSLTRFSSDVAAPPDAERLIINKGRITASSQGVSFQFPIVNQGVIENQSNSPTIFQQPMNGADVGTIISPVAGFEFFAEVMNAGSVIEINAASGPVSTSSGGRIVGGTIHSADDQLVRADVQDVTLSGDLSVRASIFKDLTIDGTARMLGSAFRGGGAHTVSGGTLLFEPSPSSVFAPGFVVRDAGVVTLAPDTIALAGDGEIQIDDGALINHGTIRVGDAGHFEINDGPFSSSGVIEVKDGATLGIDSPAFSNSGVIRIDEATLSLTGSFATSDFNLADWERTGGRVTIRGGIDNSGETLDFTSHIGVWDLYRTTIQGGALVIPDGTDLGSDEYTLADLTLQGDLVTDTYVTLDRVEHQGDLKVDALSTTWLLPAGQTELADRTITLDTGGSFSGTIRQGLHLAPDDPADDVTIAASTVVHGAGALTLLNRTAAPLDNAIINNGIIHADVPDRPLSIQVHGAGDFINNSSIVADGGAELFLNAKGFHDSEAGRIVNNGSITVDGAIGEILLQAEAQNGPASTFLNAGSLVATNGADFEIVAVRGEHIENYDPATRTLTGGSWTVGADSRLAFVVGSDAVQIGINEADVTLISETSQFVALTDHLHENRNALALLAGRDLTLDAITAPTESFINSGLISLGAGSDLVSPGHVVFDNTDMGAALHIAIAPAGVGSRAEDETVGQIIAGSDVILDNALLTVAFDGPRPVVGASWDVVVTGGSVLGSFNYSALSLWSDRSIEAVYLSDRVRLVVVPAPSAAMFLAPIGAFAASSRRRR